MNLRALGIGAQAEQAYVQLVRDGSPPSEPLASELRSAGLVQTVGGVDAPVSLEGVLSAWSSARAAEESATRAASEGLIALYEQYARRSSAPSVVRMLRGRNEAVAAAEKLSNAATTVMEELIVAHSSSAPTPVFRTSSRRRWTVAWPTGRSTSRACSTTRAWSRPSASPSPSVRMPGPQTICRFA